MSPPAVAGATSLSGRTIVVTGSSAGIGAATARLLRDRGATVVGLDREPAGSAGSADAFVQVHLGDPDSIDAAVAQLPAQVDGLCNIAGVPGTAGTEMVRAVNYLGLRHLSGHVLRRLRPGGSVACASSIAGSRWRERQPAHLALAATSTFAEGLEWCRRHPIEMDAYAYFKEALTVWTMRVAAEQHGVGVRINSVSPGPVDTRILDDFRAHLGEQRVQADIDRVGRAAAPGDVAPAFAFLMSDDSRWVTGVDLPCDGGLAAQHAVG